MNRWYSIIFLFISLTLSAQNNVWNERLDSSVIQFRRVRPDLTVIPIDYADLRRTASPSGEADPVKFIQTLPGVSSGMEGSSAYFVRGGNGGNNMTVLDGIPVYGTGHLLGLTTAYPSEILSEKNFYVGGFPSDASGFTSSLLQLTTSDGDFQKPNGSVSANSFLASALSSLPLIENRLSILAMLRVSPLGLEYDLLRPHLDTGLSIPDHLNVLAGDAFAKLIWEAGRRNRVFISLFGSYDQYEYEPVKTSSQTLGWSNLIANLTWTKETVSGWKLETRLSHNSFRAFQDQTQLINKTDTRMSVQSALLEDGLQTEASGQLGTGLDIQVGADIFLSSFRPGISKVYQNKRIAAASGKSLFTVCGSAHFQINYGDGPIQAAAGLRAVVFSSEDYKTCKPIAGLLVSFDLTPSITLKATFDHTVQFFHSLEGIPTGWSMEMLIPSTGQNKPETADQIWAGIEFSSGCVTLSASSFYKKMKDLVFFSDASSFFNSAWREWQYNLESGAGQACGIELLSHIESSCFSGQLSYTLSKTDRIFPSLNFGNPIPFKFDRRHMLNLTGEFKMSEGGGLP